MSIEVVTKASVWGDTTAEVPSMDDFENLEERLDSLKKSLSSRVTEQVFKGEISSLKEKIKATKDSISSLRSSIVDMLENGEWKTVFSGEIEAALRQLEQRFDELNSAVDEKMLALPRLDGMEEKINVTFAQQREKIREVIIEEGNNVGRKLQQLQNSGNLMEILKTEAETVKWQSDL